MAPCIFNGNTDMYGLGIRLGFYLQWFSAILARFLVPTTSRGYLKRHPLKDEAAALSFTNSVFSAATFLALLILIGRDMSSLGVVEIYIVLLLTFGYYLALVPIYLWRLLTLCNPRWDPTRWPIVRPSKVDSTLMFLLVTGVASFQLWFWIARVPQLDMLICQEYGFLMARVRLNLPAMRVVNILLYSAVLLSCVTMLSISSLKGLKNESERPKITKDKKNQRSSSRRELLQNLSIALNLAVAIIVVTATELTIKWNNVQGVYTLASAGQTIPFAIGVASFVRILYVYGTKSDTSSSPNRSGSESPIDRSLFPRLAAAQPQHSRR